ncbi:MAG: HTTM domain-containing protein [Polyangiales bacterium]
MNRLHTTTSADSAMRLATLRILVGVYALVYLAARFVYFWKFADLPATQFAPVFFMRAFDAPWSEAAYRGLFLALFPLGIAFVAGIRFEYTGRLFSLGLLAVLTYTNSWGTILHTDNLLCLHALVLGFSPSADSLSWPIDDHNEASTDSAAYLWPIKTMAILCVATYFLAGIAKLKIAGLTFIEGENLRNHVALAAVRKTELGSVSSPIGVWMLHHTGVFGALAALSLLFELAAPFALVNERLGKVWSFGAWMFHFGVLLTMAIGFFYPLSFIAFAPFFRVELLAERYGYRFRKRALNAPQTPPTTNPPA